MEKYFLPLEYITALLVDHTSGGYIFWGCDSYVEYGDEYAADKQIRPELLLNCREDIIKPRVLKSKEQQKDRTKQKAEVFTPSWICNRMNNHCDREFFKEDVFNKNKGERWSVIKNPIPFNNPCDWKEYVDSRRIEITCGEAPFLVSRYDSVSGKHIKLENRIGMLDRKLRVVRENASDDEFFMWLCRAFESTYGYEYQGDNLLIARVNFLYTFFDNWYTRFSEDADEEKIEHIINIITWNLWQMNGLSDCIPFGVESDVCEDLFSSRKTKEYLPCKIRDWRQEETLFFKDLKIGR